MKNLLAGATLLFAGIPAAAQQPVTIKMPGNFYSLQAAETKPYLLMTSRPSNEEGYLPKGVFSVIDANTGQSLWMDEMDFTKDEVNITDYGVLVTRGADYILSDTKAFMYNLDTGEEIRKIKFVPVYVDSKNDLVIGYKRKSSDMAVCRKLSTNDFIWEAEIERNRSESWKECMKISNDSIMFIGDCLYMLNTKTGAMKEYEIKNTDTRVGIAPYVSWFPLLGTTSYGIIIYADIPARYSALHSNILINGDYIYLSDKKQIACIDKDFKEKWKYTFPQETASKAMLSCRGDSIFMLNTGTKFAKTKGSYGDAFFATFEKYIGARYSYDVLPKKWNNKVFGDLLSFITDPIYSIDRSGQTIKLIEGYGRTYPVWSTDREVMMVDSKLEVQKKYSKTDVYVKWCDVDGHTIMGTIEGKASPYVVDDKGKIVKALPEECSSAKVVGEKLYLCVGHEVRIYNTHNFVNNL